MDERPRTTMLRIGDWCVNPALGQISRDGVDTRVDARAMRLLLHLAEHPGEVVSIDDLLNHVWTGVAVSPDSVYQAVTSLRRLLGDDPKQPAYIATVPRLGYRMVAAVSPWASYPSANQLASLTETKSPAHSSGRPSDTADLPSEPVAAKRVYRVRPALVWLFAAALTLAIAFALVLHARWANADRKAPAAVAPQPQKSIAVLPFLDLTQGMKEEEFADGMTEELIDKLSKIPGLRVPSPTSSFYFKDKQIPLADIARSLGVAYVVDGSVRKSGTRLRVAARLIRADNGYVVWTESYDRPLTDRLMVQDDIAGEVAKALNSSTEFKPR